MRSKSLLCAVAVAFFAGAIASPVPQTEGDITTSPEIDATTVTAALQANPDEVDELALQALQALQELEASEPTSSKRSSTCSLRNIAVRREWSSLSKSKKKEYLDAVLCLQAKPSLYDPAVVPGAKSRYDDFVATHLMQTLKIHGTASFLHWHRWYVYTFEQALRNECGYTGYQPYWNWGKTASNPLKSDLFDGSDVSFGGNGEFLGVHAGASIGGGAIQLPNGTGGGCVKTGPFKNMSVNLGPVSPAIPMYVTATATGLEYNPRCLRRDFSPYVAATYGNTGEILDLILNKNTIGEFQNHMQGNFAAGFVGTHSAGHYTVGGDPGGDIFISPGEPSFWVHHAMIDRVWWIWQNLGLLQGQDRFNVVADTITILNKPPSRDGTLDDTFNLGPSAPTDIKLRDMISTTDGPLCYVYL